MFFYLLREKNIWCILRFFEIIWFFVKFIWFIIMCWFRCVSWFIFMFFSSFCWFVFMEWFFYVIFFIFLNLFWWFRCFFGNFVFWNSVVKKFFLIKVNLFFF